MKKVKSRGARNFRHGTAVFLVRTPAQIVVAADSRQVNANNEIIPGDVCKIRKFGSGFLVVNGFTGGGAEYDFFASLAEAANKKFSLGKNADRFATALLASLIKAVNAAKKEDAAAFQRNLVEKPALGFCAFGIENGRLVFYQREFWVVSAETDDEMDIRIIGRNLPDADNPGGMGFYLVGPSEEFNDKFFEKYPKLRGGMSTGLISVARDYVQMQTDEGVKDVGGPIDIMRVTPAGGFAWVQKKAGYED